MRTTYLFLVLAMFQNLYSAWVQGAGRKVAGSFSVLLYLRCLHSLFSNVTVSLNRHVDSKKGTITSKVNVLNKFGAMRPQFIPRTGIFFTFFSAAVFAQTPTLDQYRLGSGDVIKIMVYGQQDLSVETRMTDVGTINYPYLGEIKIVGSTVSQIEALIYSGLKGDYLVDPSVSVSITDYRPFFINGEVKKPGGYSYQPGLTVDKAASIAGGYTERALKERFVITRLENGTTREFTLNRSSTVLPGDIVTVETSFF